MLLPTPIPQVAIGSKSRPCLVALPPTVTPPTTKHGHPATPPRQCLLGAFVIGSAAEIVRGEEIRRRDQIGSNIPPVEHDSLRQLGGQLARQAIGYNQVLSVIHRCLSVKEIV